MRTLVSPRGLAAVAAAVTLSPMAASAADGVETVERVKVFEFAAKPKAKVRFTIGTKNGGGVRAALWYKAESPNGDGKKIWHDVERIELTGANADRTMGLYEMPNGPCARLSTLRRDTPSRYATGAMPGNRQGPDKIGLWPLTNWTGASSRRWSRTGAPATPTSGRGWACPRPPSSAGSTGCVPPAR